MGRVEEARQVEGVQQVSNDNLSTVNITASPKTPQEDYG